MTTPIPASAILSELTAIHEFLTAAQEIMREGHMPDIHALEDRVADVCKVIEAAEKGAQKTCLPALKNILTHMDEVTADMKAWKSKQA